MTYATNRVAAAVALLLTAVLLPTAPAWAQEGSQGNEPSVSENVIIQPGEGSTLVERGGWYLIEGDNGSRSQQTVEITNTFDQPITFDILPVDASTGPYGGVSYATEDQENEAVGTWINLETNEATIPPGETRIIPFTVRIPNRADEGVWLGGVAISIEGAEQEQEVEEGGEDEAGASIVVRTRRVIAVEVRIPGDDAPVMNIQGIEPLARPQGLTLGINMENTGRGLTVGTGTVEMDDGFTSDFEFSTFVPRTEITYPILWENAPSEGEHCGTVTITWEPEGTDTWNGCFVIDATVQAELENRVPPTTTQTPIPWWVWALIIGLVILLIIFAFIAWKRRKDKETPEEMEERIRRELAEREAAGGARVDTPGASAAPPAAPPAGSAPFTPDEPATGRGNGAPAATRDPDPDPTGPGEHRGK